MRCWNALNGSNLAKYPLQVCLLSREDVCWYKSMCVDVYVPVRQNSFGLSRSTKTFWQIQYVFLFAREHLVLTGWDYLCGDELWKLPTYAAYASFNFQVSKWFKRRSFQQRSLGVFLMHALHAHSMMGLRLHMTCDNTWHHVTSPDQGMQTLHAVQPAFHPPLGTPSANSDILCLLFGIHEVSK